MSKLYARLFLACSALFWHSLGWPDGPPGVDVSAYVQVIGGSPTLNPKTGFYVDTLTLFNPPESGQKVYGPLYVALASTSTGDTTFAEPDGLSSLGPYVQVARAKASLAPGQQIRNIKLRFMNASGAAFEARYAVYGQLAPPATPEATPTGTRNSRPIARAGRDITGRIGHAVSLDGALSKDRDADPLSYAWSLLGRPDGSDAQLVADPRRTSGAGFTPDLPGEYLLQLTVNDGALDSLPDTVKVAVPENRPPRIASKPPVQAAVGQPYRYAVTASDRDEDALSYALVSGPAGMAIDSAGHVLWLPQPDLQGQSPQVVVQVSDGKAGGATAQAYSLQVQPAPGLLAEIPSLVGMDQFSAAAALSAAGFDPGASAFRNDEAAPNGTVLAQDLPPGQQAVQGTAVTLTVSLGPAISGATNPADLPPPEHIALRTAATSFNSKYEASVKNHRIFIRPKTEDAWQELSVHPELKGKAEQVSMDDQMLVATDAQGRLYSLGLDAISLGAALTAGTVSRPELFMKLLPGALEAAHGLRGELGPIIDQPGLWSNSWGAPFALGPGIALPPGTTAWSLSVVSPFEDGYYTDAGGYSQNIGAGNCTTVFALNDSGRRITVLDPWLPADYSYELGLPKRNGFVAQGLSASGSTLFVIDSQGEMWTRRWDFDMSGGDAPFFPSAYDRRPAPVASLKWLVDSALPGSKNVALGWPPYSVQLPLAGPDPGNPDEAWTHQPRIDLPGVQLYDAISIAKTVSPSSPDGLAEPGASQRTLRVPGTISDAGWVRTGYFEKGLQETAWTFHQANFPGNLIPGNLVAGASPSLAPTFPPASYEASGLLLGLPLEGLKVALDDFILPSSPAKLSLSTASGGIQLKLHFHDGLRRVIPLAPGTPYQISFLDETRTGPNGGRELDSQTRMMYGAIEIPDALAGQIKQDPAGKAARMLWSFLGPMVNGSCAAGQDTLYGFCYPKCQAGYEGAGPLCVVACPPGAVNLGFACLKPAPYGRGVGYAIWDQAKCQRNHGSCELYGLIWYPKCAAGFHNFGCCVCTPDCSARTVDIGAACLKVESYARTPTLMFPKLIHVEMPVTADSVQIRAVQTDLNLAGPTLWKLNRKRP